MKTFKRICIKDFDYEDIHLCRGKEYITTPEENGVVTVFSDYWYSNIPVNIFAGELQFTGEKFYMQ